MPCRPQALVMNPPKPGDPSYEQFARERDTIIEVCPGWHA